MRGPGRATPPGEGRGGLTPGVGREFPVVCVQSVILLMKWSISRENCHGW